MRGWAVGRVFTRMKRDTGLRHLDGSETRSYPTAIVTRFFTWGQIPYPLGGFPQFFTMSVRGQQDKFPRTVITAWLIFKKRRKKKKTQKCPSRRISVH